MDAYERHPLYRDRKQGSNGEVVEACGMSFVETELHSVWDSHRWQALRQAGDPLADACLKLGLGRHTGHAALLSDPLAELSAAAATDQDSPLRASCRALLLDLNAVPAWVDFDAVTRAQRWYLRNLPLASLSLLHVGLIAGFGAPQIHPTLNATGYLTSSEHPSKTRRRVFETTAFVAACLGRNGPSDDGRSCMRPGESGWEACAKVRLIHAAVRHRLLSSDKWDVEALGLPVCLADMCATQLAFSCCTLLGLANAGVGFTEDEADDFCHMWRFVGHLLGVAPHCNPCVPRVAVSSNNAKGSFAAASSALEMASLHVLKPDHSGSVQLASSVLRALGASWPLKAPFEQHAAWSHRLMGKTLANSLKLPEPSTWGFQSLVVSVFVWFCRFMAWLAAPRIDQAYSSGFRAGIAKYIENRNYRVLSKILQKALHSPSSRNSCPAFDSPLVATLHPNYS